MSGRLHSSAVYGTAVLPAADRAPLQNYGNMLWQPAVPQFSFSDDASLRFVG